MEMINFILEYSLLLNVYTISLSYYMQFIFHNCQNAHVQAAVAGTFSGAMVRLSCQRFAPSKKTWTIS